VQVAEVKEIGLKVYEDIGRTRVTAIAGGLAYFFLLSVFPLLVVLATALGFLPIPNLFDRGMEIMARFVPGDAMGLVRETLKGILSPSRGALLSVGILGTIWTASGGFSSLMDALDIAYDAKAARPWWKQKLIAVALTFVVGGLFSVGLVASILGPEFGQWITNFLHLSKVFAMVWPLLRWGTMLVSVVLAIELLYYIGPNVKQRFKATLPGAVIATVFWLVASFALGVYISHFGSYNKTYGSIGAVIVLMLWLYVTSIILLVGAEVNSEMQKRTGECLEGQASHDVPTKVVAPPRAA